MTELIPEPRFTTLVGIDSDGCVLDSMTVKQCLHFFPLIIQFWRLERFREPFTACARFVNFDSATRGANRFLALLREFELLKAYPGLLAAGYRPPDFSALAAYVQSGVPLGTETLRAAAESTGDPELARVLAWNLALNAELTEHLEPIRPFQGAIRALQAIQRQSDAVVISQTPEASVSHDWELNGIRLYVAAIAGMEFGRKAEQLRAASRGRYAPGRVLMIGDAIGDESAAAEAGACFYPILPGREEASWDRFLAESYPRFLAGTYAGGYQRELVKAFDAALPETPPPFPPFVPATSA